MSKRLLTKSRFKIGVECPTKLHFLDNREYGNTNTDNSFLLALAEGGFQVGELAKLYYPGGTEIETLDKTEALAQTAALLENKNAVIYEAAFAFQDLFIRADIVVKSGNSIHLIEVKAKSYDPTEKDQFYTKTSLKKGDKKISSGWEPYLLDAAFQCHVIRSAYPKMKVRGSLMLADKSVTATVDGLNQKFLLRKDKNGRVSANVAEGITSANIGRKVLVEVPVDEEMEVIYASSYECGAKMYPFLKLVEFLSGICTSKEFVKPVIGSHCKSCEFRTDDEDKADGISSGFEKCWAHAAKVKPADFKREFVFEIWNFRKSGNLIESGKLFVDQLSFEDINPTANPDKQGLSNSERQWLQVEKITTKDKQDFVDIKGLSAAFSEWTYPLHFIDFETTMVAIPFHAGRRPYEQMAFQFSHHRVDADGTITHCDEYINRKRGAFPNFDFVRALMRALSGDNGTIFRYATHENTVLNQIKSQILSSDAPPKDADKLVAFIESITSFENGAGKSVSGNRCMVDLCELVKGYYYSPRMKGSNSIKVVLPAILNGSEYLQKKYSAPIYGAKGGIISKNFKDWKWIKKSENGDIVDPYKQLPAIFTDIELDEMDALLTDGSIADGGAAMTAYSRMQFTEMSEDESERVAAALLKYCELDTFAMVMIWEHWNNELVVSGSRAKKRA